MTLAQYTNLIKSLPYLDQAFETKRQTWNREYSSDEEFKIYCDKEFVCATIKLSRRDLFLKAEIDFYDAVVSIIFWGYPGNMRGNHFQNILSSIPKIKEVLTTHKEISNNDFKRIVNNLKQTGVGLSTLTKFLYFFEFKVEGLPCLILDSRIIEIVKTQLYEELHSLKNITEFNKMNQYIHYLKEMDENSKAGGYKADQLELFLYQFGKYLKSDD